MMKLAILGAAGVRTPLIIEEIIRRQNQLHIHDLTLMDIDQERLDLISAITIPIENSPEVEFTIHRTTDPVTALHGADYVITTFRVGGIESRVIDERVALELGLLGQETTGPGGFAMGLRSIPVLLKYIQIMREHCPDAWLINFANPSGMMAEAVQQYGKWQRAVGICDGPSSMLEMIARFASLPLDELTLEYFGLNHLGWIRSIKYKDQNIVPMLIRNLAQMGSVPGFHIHTRLVERLNMIPNEYLYYYYHSRQAVENILQSGQTRGELVANLNKNLFARLKELKQKEELETMRAVHADYIHQRGVTYMRAETSGEQDKNPEKILQEGDDLGYARLALYLIEALEGGQTRQLIVNIPNQGSISGMSATDVVEIPAWISKDHIQPVMIGEVPDHCLGLMKLVKTYEKLTIEAAVDLSYQKAVDAIALHPLVADYPIAEKLVSGYLQRHGDYFSKLN